MKVHNSCGFVVGNKCTKFLKLILSFCANISSSLLHIGALVTLLAIAVDPFSQQLVQYSQRLKSSVDGAATIARAQRFSRGITLVGTATADYSIQAGIFNALIQEQYALVQQTSFTCPTSNCTWDPVESLAVCSTCNNLTSQLSRYNEPGFLYNDLHKRIVSSNVPENSTSLTLPNGLYINNIDGVPYHKPADHIDFVSGTVQAIFMISFGTSNASRKNSFKDSDSLLWAMSFLKMQASRNDTVHSDGWPNVPVLAVECSLSFCVKQYSSFVRHGILYETETSMTDFGRHPESWQLIDYTDNNLDGIHLDNYDIDSLKFNSSTSSVSRTDLMLGNDFNLSWEAVNSLSSQFQSRFAAPKPINITQCSNLTKDLDYSPINRFYKNQINSCEPNALEISPDILQLLHGSQDLNETFRRIARGLSNAIRAGDDNATIRTGASSVMTIYYRIQWPWIALHIIVITGAIVFIVVMMLQSAKGNIPIWKSSALASLSNIPKIGDVLVGMGVVEEMEERARTHLVQLFKNSILAQGGRTNASQQP